MGFDMRKSGLNQEGWKYLFGAATLLAAVGFTLKTIQPAHAVNGPSVNLGSNPVFNYYEDGWANFYSGQKSLNFNIPSGQVLILTKFDVTGSSDCYFDINGVSIPLDSISKLKVDSSMSLALESRRPGNSSDWCGGSSWDNRIYVEGYYSKE